MNDPDPDRDSQLLRWDHELLWTKELCPGVLFAPKVTTRKREYLIFTDGNEKRHCYGSDAITSSYSRWVTEKRPRSRALVEAIAGLTDDQKSVYLDPPYTIGSAMIWPLRTRDLPTMNTARGLRMSVADRMDLTLECVRRHYTGEPGSALADVTDAYKDFFELFGQREQGFKEFVDFFHFQDLVTPDYTEVRFYLPFKSFEHSGVPVTTKEYGTYRNATLQFIAGRGVGWTSGSRNTTPKFRFVTLGGNPVRRTTTNRAVGHREVNGDHSTTSSAAVYVRDFPEVATRLLSPRQ